jgi:hypothetical protein
MMIIRKKLVETVSFRVHVQQRDIDEGVCMSISLCMHKIAIERELRKLDPSGGDHKVRIDGGNVKFNLGGFRFVGITPRIVKQTLVAFDRERKARARAEREGVAFVSKVKPLSYPIKGHKIGKVEPMTKERQEQINAARRRRIAAGKPDKYRYDIRHRIEGLGNV